MTHLSCTAGSVVIVALFLEDIGVWPFQSTRHFYCVLSSLSWHSTGTFSFTWTSLCLLLFLFLYLTLLPFYAFLFFLCLSSSSLIKLPHSLSPSRFSSYAVSSTSLLLRPPSPPLNIPGISLPPSSPSLALLLRHSHTLLAGVLSH